MFHGYPFRLHLLDLFSLFKHGIHTIDGPNGGVPNRLAEEHRNTTRVRDGVIPSVDAAVAMYETSGGHLSQDSSFGVDPLSQYPREQSYRIRDFRIRYSSFEVLYCNVVSGSGEEYKRAIIYFQYLTQQYAMMLAQ